MYHSNQLRQQYRHTRAAQIEEACMDVWCALPVTADGCAVVCDLL